MKKNLFFAALAITALVSCSESDYLGDERPSPVSSSDEVAIEFGTGIKKTTRAEWTGAAAAEKLNNNFVFLGTKTVSSASSTVFDHYNANWTQNTANTTESNSNDWEYVGYTPASTSLLPGGATQSIKYWDYAASQYDFAAYSLGKGVDDDNNDATDNTFAVASQINFANLGKATSGANDYVYKLTGTVAELKECYISDLVTAYNTSVEDDTGPNNIVTYKSNTFGQVVTFSFRSLASKIRLAFYETIPGYSVTDLEFYNVVENGGNTTVTPAITEAVNGTPKLLTANDNASLPIQFDDPTTPVDQELKVYFPTTGFAASPSGKSPDTDYNKAHIVFSSSGATSNLTFDGLNDFANSEKYEDADEYLGRASNTATYAGGIDPETGAGKYYTILPNEAGVNLMIRVKYKLVSIDGSDEVINVDNATAVIPLQLAQWKPNYAYTYIFKISDMTNGTTGVNVETGDPVMGLTPITLNAVVVDSENGVQETITTVTDPSITTYMAGKVVTDKDEYKVYGTPTTHPIYVVVNDGSDNVELTPGTNAQLYTAVLDGSTATANTSAINPISEESVDNALRYGVLESGKTLAGSSTFTVTDANGWKLILTKVGASDDDKLTAASSIPASESPTGDAVTLTCASFVPVAPASGTKYYVFQYKGNTSGAYGTYNAVAPAELATSGTTYYTYANNTYTEVASVSSGTKVISGGTVYYTKGADIYEPVTGALTAGTYYYYAPSNGSANSDGYVAYTYTSGDAPTVDGGYYTKQENYIPVPFATLNAGDTYYTSGRGAGKFVATGSEVVDAENKYWTETAAETDAGYMYKIIKVVNP